MLSGITKFFSSAENKAIEEAKRIEKLVEFKRVLILIDKLRIKSEELKTSSEINGFDSLDHRKYLIVLSLLKQFDVKINEFNEEKPQTPQNAKSDIQTEAKKMILLAQDLATIISNLSEENRKTLNTHRGANLSAAATAIDVVSTGATFAAAKVMSFGTFATMWTLFAVAPLVSDGSKKAVGLSSQEVTATAILLAELYDILNNTIKNIKLSITLDSSLEEKPTPHPFLCPITMTLMKDPVICNLDGVSYERQAIKRWLNEHKSSPINRARLQQDQKAEDVLVDNRNLKDIIEKYVKENLIDTETESTAVNLRGSM